MCDKNSYSVAPIRKHTLIPLTNYEVTPQVNSRVKNLKNEFPGLDGDTDSIFISNDDPYFREIISKLMNK